MGSYKEFLPLMAATGDIEQIHPALHHPGQLLVVFQVQPPFRKVITVHADLYGEPGAYRLAHPIQGHQEEPRPVLQAAAELILPVVFQRCSLSTASVPKTKKREVLPVTGRM